MKRFRWLSLVLAMVMAITVFAGCGTKDLEDALTEFETATTNNSQDAPEIDYTKGTFDGSVYVNEWADIKFALPVGFSNADDDTYATAENSTTECGAYFIADDTMSLIYFCYEKLPSFPIYDEEKYLDAVMDSLESVSGITYQTPNTYSTATIAGYTYAKAECKLTNDYGDFTNTFYVRKHDDYMIVISAMGINKEANDALVSKITKAN